MYQEFYGILISTKPVLQSIMVEQELNGSGETLQGFKHLRYTQATLV